MSDYIAEFELSKKAIETEFSVKKEPIKATFSMEVTSTGTFNHNELLNRDIADQHPISAITGLTEELNSLDDKINIEKVRAESEESRLDGKIDDEIVARTQDIADLSQELANEVQRATNQENELSEKIDTVEDDLTEDIDSLTTIVENNYTTLDNRITEVASELEQTIEENVVALQQEDTALQNQINAHSTTLTAHDTRITNNTNAITQEITDRQNADDNLQEQIDGITAGSDVKDIVGTYAELQAYDKSTLGNNDIIKVLQDETQEGASTYYRYILATQSFSYIGKEGPFYTKSESDTLLNAKQDTIPDLVTIRNNASDGKIASDTIATYGNIVTHNTDEFQPVGDYATRTELNTKANDSDVVKKTGNENINGVKTFTGGTGGNNVAIKVPNGIAIGGLTQTADSQYASIRLVNNAVNTGSYYIDGNGSVLFRHKTGSSTAEGSANDVMFTMNPVTGIKAGFSGTAGAGITDADTHDVLIDTISYTKLDTTNKDVLGAINELNSGKQENLDIILLSGAVING